MEKICLIFLIIAVLLLNTCDDWSAMSNDEIITETKKCKNEGMDVEVLRGETKEIYKVQCVPKPSDGKQGG
jgi:hypothetical protein